jgi:hypothetical protein
MPSRKQWVFSPDTGGVKIPDSVKRDVQKRIEAVAAKRLKGKYTRLDIRFKAQFCYIDAYQEPPKLTKGWPPKDWPETREAYLERLRNTPTHLCRLRYFGDERWGWAFYTYSHEKYEFSYFPNGEAFGKPEEAFLTAATIYLDSGPSA